MPKRHFLPWVKVILGTMVGGRRGIENGPAGGGGGRVL